MIGVVAWGCDDAPSTQPTDRGVEQDAARDAMADAARDATVDAARDMQRMPPDAQLDARPVDRDATVDADVGAPPDRGTDSGPRVEDRPPPTGPLPPSWEAPYVEPDRVPVPPAGPKAIDQLPGPRDAEGRIAHLEIEGVRMVFDPVARDALTATGACVDLIVRCARAEGPSIDACVHSVPECATDTPWTEDADCCAAACKPAYARHRRAGVIPPRAVRQTFFGAGSCMPGVADLLREGN